MTPYEKFFRGWLRALRKPKTYEKCCAMSDIDDEFDEYPELEFVNLVEPAPEFFTISRSVIATPENFGKRYRMLANRDLTADEKLHAKLRPIDLEMKTKSGHVHGDNPYQIPVQGTSNVPAQTDADRGWWYVDDEFIEHGPFDHEDDALHAFIRSSTKLARANDYPFYPAPTVKIQPTTRPSAGQINGANPYYDYNDDSWGYVDEDGVHHAPFDHEHDALYALMYHVVKPGLWRRICWLIEDWIDRIDRAIWRN